MPPCSQMGEVFEEVTGLGPVGVEDLFLTSSNEETSVDYELKELKVGRCNVSKTLMIDEGDYFLTFLLSIDFWLFLSSSFSYS